MTASIFLAAFFPERLPDTRAKEAPLHSDALCQPRDYQSFERVLRSQVSSYSGPKWIEDYLEAAARGFENHCKSFDLQNSPPVKSAPSRIGRSVDSREFDWRDLAHILELGECYE